MPWKRLWLLVLFVLFDVILGKLGLALAKVHPSASLIWPVIGFDLAMVMTFGLWPLLAVFVGAFIYNLLTFGSVVTCLFIALGNVLKVWIAYKLFNREDIIENLKRFVLACVPAAAAGATIGVASLFVKQDLFGPDWYQYIWIHWSIGGSAGKLLGITWLNWFLGDFLGLVIFTPVFVWLFKTLRISK